MPPRASMEWVLILCWIIFFYLYCIFTILMAKLLGEMICVFTSYGLSWNTVSGSVSTRHFIVGFLLFQAKSKERSLPWPGIQPRFWPLSTQRFTKELFAFGRCVSSQCDELGIDNDWMLGGDFSFMSFKFCLFLVNCGFEKDFCGWESLPGFQWKRNYGPTSSQHTGPKTDHNGNQTGTQSNLITSISIQVTYWMIFCFTCFVDFSFSYWPFE